MALKRKIDETALGWLVVVTVSAAGALVWSWVTRLSVPGKISCSGGGITVPHCSSSFGDDATLICVIAVPLMGWLTHKAFFTRYGRSK